MRLTSATERLRADALRILTRGVAAADPGAAIHRALHVNEGVLQAGDISLPLDGIATIRLVGAGKAAAAMAGAAVDVLGSGVASGTITVAAPSGAIPGIESWPAGHPVPDVGGLAGAAEALAVARSAGDDDLVLCLLSGGASALWAAPAAGLTLADLQGATAALLRSGAPIESVNAVRKHLSRIAGGGLARAAHPARVLTLAVSDVIGCPVDAIGSGPTLPDTTTFEDALDVVDRYGVDLPAAALHHLRIGAAGTLRETARAEELDNVLGFVVVLSVEDALAGAAAEAEKLGYLPRVMSAALRGEAREAGGKVAAEATGARRDGDEPVALLWGGETTVTVRGEGRGGRNQEVALAAAVGLRGASGVVVAALGTDGRDGPTDAAGAVVDGGTVERGVAAGLDVSATLHANDSYGYLEATGDLIRTGATGTNVNDLTIALLSSSSEAPA